MKKFVSSQRSVETHKKKISFERKVIDVEFSAIRNHRHGFVCRDKGNNNALINPSSCDEY